MVDDKEQPDTGIELIGALLDDCSLANSLFHAEDSAFNRRNLFRVFFAAVEGCVFDVKQTLLEAAGDIGYSDAEISLLREESYELTDNGEVIARQKFLRVEDNFLFAMNLLTSPLEERFNVDRSSSGWRAFCQSVRVRNRLTHPKYAEALTVTDEELRALRQAMDWFRIVLADALQEAGRLNMKRAEGLRRTPLP
jgi:hypothetical protein